MTPGGRVVLLIGSPKPQDSTSEVLGTYLTGCLADHGFSRGETFHLQHCVEDPERLPHLFDAVARADLVVLSTPLYIDSLPAPATRALELIAEERDGSTGGGDEAPQPRFVAIVNAGFPEASQAQIAVDICRVFAGRADLEWTGGLALGGASAVIGGRPLGEREKMTRTVRGALELAADALAAGLPVPDAAVELMARPLVKPRLYRLMGNWGFKRQGRRNGAGDLGARPYAK